MNLNVILKVFILSHRATHTHTHTHTQDLEIKILFLLKVYSLKILSPTLLKDLESITAS